MQWVIFKNTQQIFEEYVMGGTHGHLKSTCRINLHIAWTYSTGYYKSIRHQQTCGRHLDSIVADIYTCTGLFQTFHLVVPCQVWPTHLPSLSGFNMDQCSANYQAPKCLREQTPNWRWKFLTLKAMEVRLLLLLCGKNMTHSHATIYYGRSGKYGNWTGTKALHIPLFLYDRLQRTFEQLLLNSILGVSILLTVPQIALETKRQSGNSSLLRPRRWALELISEPHALHPAHCPIPLTLIYKKWWLTHTQQMMDLENGKWPGMHTSSHSSVFVMIDYEESLSLF